MPRLGRSALLPLVIATLALSGFLSASAPSAVGAQPVGAGDVHLNSYERALLSDLNHARRRHGLPSLMIAAGTTDVARRWSAHLAEKRQLSHNPHLAADVARSGSRDWGTIEENVGYGPASSPHALFEAYMRSPVHRANVLDKAVRYVGIGIVWRGSFAWNTTDFVNEYSRAYGHSRVTAAST